MLINPEEMRRAGLSEGQRVTLECAVADEAAGAGTGKSDEGGEADGGTGGMARTRSVANMRIVPYDLPDGCIGAYYPETNALVPLDRHDIESKTPAYKGTPVRIVA